mmetsp:Transcript_44722/g.91264  ORF Transcript_44722/g.91264 Transcript_44722/m.91264 type:complete len:114 (+) Transcript_44722:179-520(+)|eukprot:CAMPEP_0181306622 /NCGR_PEP_ID=MMETSP1101-20121128/10407_1 /TAXON_ID=46948 /ORGANISM="Rhodomonas abbreviata, Strain Caron Lab Isolate" /LENGTH=113 /DNA_ID=CAMNT_0023412709 /DNA_START=156 /DNA_END=497 /DNA_ORIENTATION=-
MIDPTGLHTGGHDAIADALVWQDVVSHAGHTEKKEAQPAKAAAEPPKRKAKKEPLQLVDFPRDQADLYPHYWSDGVERRETPLEGQHALADITPHLDIHILGARLYCARPVHY